jgi:glyceraldehyde 3-phosphate dehydrogenase
MLAHLLKYDSAQGRYSLADKVESKESSIVVAGKEIEIYAQKDPKNLPWSKLDVDVVLECTGFFTSKEKASAHIEAGAKKVVISAPAGNNLPIIVYGVNENVLNKNDTVISAASCTTNCLALMVDVLDKLAQVEKGFMTTIHAYTGDQMTLDGPHAKGDLRRARAAALNIVPTSSGAAKAIGLVIPKLEGKLDGVSQRVPVPAGSVTELVAVVNKTVKKDDINTAMKAASSDSFGYTEEQLVSSDIIGITYGSLFDATLTKVTSLPDGRSLVKVVAWYDNENSYTSQMVRAIKYFAEL